MHGSPWRWIRSLTHVTVLWSDHLPDGVCGLAEFDSQTITLANGLTQAERRSVVDHERRHLERGRVPEHLRAREERAIDDEVARYLIPFSALVDAMVWSQDDCEVAAELTVAVHLVRVRLHGLTDAESVELNRRLDENELMLP